MGQGGPCPGEEHYQESEYHVLGLAVYAATKVWEAPIHGKAPIHSQAYSAQDLQISMRVLDQPAGRCADGFGHSVVEVCGIASLITGKAVG